MVVVRDLTELGKMISTRDNINIDEANRMIRLCAADMETAFYNGDLGLAEEILRSDLGLEPDYLDLFIY